VEIEDDELELAASFALGAASNGIAPATEAVTLGVGAFVTTIPAGSFRLDRKGRFKFEGIVDGVELKVVIQPRRGGRVALKAEAERVDLMGTVNPVTVRIKIGDDSATTSVGAELEDDDDDHDGDDEDDSDQN
jgi:ABC-type nitrate/sulfonate/bicarbonate transport system substrate-binding protein